MLGQKKYGRIGDRTRAKKARKLKNKFARLHTWLGDYNEGEIIPIGCYNVLAGDRVKYIINGTDRLDAFRKPIYSGIKKYIYVFYISKSQILHVYRKVMGEKNDPAEMNTEYVQPHIIANSKGFPRDSLYDKFGIPVERAGISVVIDRLIAYNMICNKYFRAAYLEKELYTNYELDTDQQYPEEEDEDQSIANWFTIQRIYKSRDQFTSAMPSTQLGLPATLSLIEEAPLKGVADYAIQRDSTGEWDDLAGQTLTTNGSGTTYEPVKLNTNHHTNVGFIGLDLSRSLEGSTKPTADLSAATGITAQMLAFLIGQQQVDEMSLQGGVDYPEIMFSLYGEYIPDRYNAKPELLGMFKENLIVTPIANTTGASNISEPQGNLTSVSFMTSIQRKCSGYANDNGIIMILLATRAEQHYQYGLNKEWNERTKWDIHQPTLDNIGEQPILNQEIYCQDETVVDTDGTPINKKVWAFQEAWSELKFGTKIVTGSMKSDHPQTTDYFHTGEDYDTLPVFNAEFLKEMAPMDRLTATTNNPDFTCKYDIIEVKYSNMGQYSLTGGLTYP